MENISNTNNVKLEDPYFIKYRDYFDVDEHSNKYYYRIKLVNNEKYNYILPANCLKCNSSIDKNSLKETIISFPVVKEKTTSEMKFTFFVLWLVIIIVFYIILPKLGIIFFFASLFLYGLYLFSKTPKNSTQIKLYYCPSCQSSICSVIPDKIITVDTPKDFFQKIEKLEGFKLN